MDRASFPSEQPQDPESSKVSEKSTFKRGSVAGVLQFLYSRVEGELDSEDLEFLSGSGELACHMAMNLASTINSIGCLVSNDDEPGKMQSGDFRTGRDFADLMFTVANVVDVIGEFANIASESSFLLREGRING